MIGMLKLSVRSCFRIWIRANRHLEDTTRRRIPRYCPERCGFNADRWQRLYGRATIGKGIKEIFTNP